MKGFVQQKIWLLPFLHSTNLNLSYKSLNQVEKLILIYFKDVSGNPVTQSVIPVTDSSGNVVTGMNLNQNT